ncbi:MAG: hypothetical protein DHS20C12_17360 [Pseudohongiella sp.]|nr:MAG: hypothetical protein DHS20C12_17360 [Pseudohongiella sp.]
MDELEFRKRVYNNPSDVDEELLEAARANPRLQKILDETRAFEDSLSGQLESPEAPKELIERLLSIPENDELENDNFLEANPNLSSLKAKKQSYRQYFALAASLVLAVGIVFSLNINSRNSSSDLSLRDGLLAHLYHDIEEIDGINNGELYQVLDIDEVNSAMADTGARLVSYDGGQEFEVRSAKPCVILPAYQSAHLLIEGSQGAVSIVVIKNSPVDVEYSIRDERFNGIVMPMEQGNIIFVGEKGEDLNQYAALFSENIELVI